MKLLKNWKIFLNTSILSVCFGVIGIGTITYEYIERKRLIKKIQEREDEIEELEYYNIPSL